MNEEIDNDVWRETKYTTYPLTWDELSEDEDGDPETKFDMSDIVFLIHLDADLCPYIRFKLSSLIQERIAALSIWAQTSPETLLHKPIYVYSKEDKVWYQASIIWYE
jgi:hypothetical protein